MRDRYRISIRYLAVVYEDQRLCAGAKGAN